MLTLNNCTIYDNTAVNGAGIFMSTCADHCEIQSAKNTIVANNTGANCNQGGFASFGHNLDSDGTCGFGDLIGDPLLGPLANNGGPTKTHALAPGSPAIDAVPLAFCTTTLNLAVSTDQRGVHRPQFSNCDIGAYELAPVGIPGPSTGVLNISTRLRVLTGDNVGIGGFIITGTAPKHVLIRATGPSLTQFGVPDVLADPVLELHGPGTFATTTNDNWRDDSAQEAAIIATGIPPTNNLESAIDATVNPGAYTAVLRGKNNTSGVALIEAYDLSQAVLAKLANLSTRAFVSTGDNIVIAGFVLGDQSGSDRIAVRGIGPSLTAVGVTNALADPTLELRDGNGALLTANNDWQDDPAQAAELAAAGLAPANQLESGIAATLPPGTYTALLAGHNNGTGVGLVEFYDLGDSP